MLTVVLMLWKNDRHRWWRHYLYTMDHVNRAINMISRNCSIPHRFTLVTDDIDGAKAARRWEPNDVDVTMLPIDKKLLALGGCWPKLMLYQPQARERFGERLLYVDLDSVVLRDIAPLASDHDIRFMRATSSSASMHYNAGMILLRTGTRNVLWEKFRHEDAARLVAENDINATDQWWICKTLGAGEATWSEADGVVSYRKYALAGVDLPQQTRIVMFPGPFDPSVPRVREQHRWIRDHWR